MLSSRRNSVALVMLGLALALTRCGGGGNGDERGGEVPPQAPPAAPPAPPPEAGEPGTEPQPSPSPTLEPAANEVTLRIVQGARVLGRVAFGPNPLVIAPGVTVTWVNEDNVPHTVSSTTGLFESGTLNPGQSFVFQFNEPGTFNYFCRLHPSMIGTVQAE